MGQTRCTDEHATESRLQVGRGQVIRAAAALLFASLLLGMPAAADPPVTRGSSEESGPKAYWQDRYRTLLQQADQLRAIIETERELYADANRRNYRRGTKRHQHRIKAQEAEEKLKAVEAELATIQDDGRRAGALPGWFYEVEIEGSAPASASPPESGPGDAGRNPLYTDDEG